MGARGPAPKPTSLRVLHGDKRSRINEREPMPPQGAPRPLKQLRPEARVHYRRIARLLDAMRVTTAWDGDMLALYADALTEYFEADALVQEHGMLIGGRSFNRTNEKGETVELVTNLVRNPALMVKNHAFARAYRLGAQFGLTPAARTSLVAGPARDPAGVKALLS